MWFIRNNRSDKMLSWENEICNWKTRAREKRAREVKVIFMLKLREKREWMAALSLFSQWEHEDNPKTLFSNQKKSSHDLHQLVWFHYHTIKFLSNFIFFRWTIDNTQFVNNSVSFFDNRQRNKSLRNFCVIVVNQWV